MLSSIYDKHRAAFATAAAYTVMRGPDRVATIAVKFGAAVTVYAHWIGIEMTAGRAGGGGYDRVSAAASAAAAKMPAELPGDTFADGTPHHPEDERDAYRAFRAALLADDGLGWERRLRDAGFTVWQAV